MITKPIKPISIFSRGTAESFSFTSANIAPDSGALIFWQLSGDSGVALQNGSLEMPKEIYDQWAGDDEFPLLWSAGVLGVELL